MNRAESVQLRQGCLRFTSTKSRLFGQVILAKNVKLAVTKSKTECLRRCLILSMHCGGFGPYGLK